MEEALARSTGHLCRGGQGREGNRSLRRVDREGKERETDRGHSKVGTNEGHPDGPAHTSLRRPVITDGSGQRGPRLWGEAVVQVLALPPHPLSIAPHWPPGSEIQRRANLGPLVGDPKEPLVGGGVVCSEGTEGRVSTPAW